MKKRAPDPTLGTHPGMVRIRDQLLQEEDPLLDPLALLEEREDGQETPDRELLKETRTMELSLTWLTSARKPTNETLKI